MSTYCKYCGVVSRNACSDYKQKYLAEELSKCPNLYPDERLRAAASAEGYDGPYNELLRYREKFGPLDD